MNSPGQEKLKPLRVVHEEESGRFEVFLARGFTTPGVL
jgi:hypothetical protein